MKIMTTPSEEFMKRRKGELWKEIVDIAASDQGTPAERKRECVKKLDEFEMVIMTICSRPFKYVGCERPIDAVRMYLEEEGVGRTKRDIIASVLNGGYRGGLTAPSGLGEAAKRGLPGKIGAAIGVHLGQGKGASGDNALREHNGLIGLADWDDSRF
ncbi:hypothetical protein DYQ86_15875 [Acidobacteria bacterium AB60]|nr:hypothetical protein DYQ86_15875 [Acidobacteria bacterium AB60]